MDVKSTTIKTDLNEIKPPVHRKIIKVQEYYRSPNKLYDEKPHFQNALDEVCLLETQGWTVEKITTVSKKFNMDQGSEEYHYYHMKKRGVLL